MDINMKTYDKILIDKLNSLCIYIYIYMHENRSIQKHNSEEKGREGVWGCHASRSKA